MFYGHLVCFVDIWYVYRNLVYYVLIMYIYVVPIFSWFLVNCTKINLAALDTTTIRTYLTMKMEGGTGLRYMHTYVGIALYNKVQ
jgi:hypothetical protein